MPTTLDEASVQRLQDLMDGQVASGVLPSCSAAIAVDGEVMWTGTAGPVTRRSRYVIFSATKALVSAAVWQLLDEGTLRLDQPVRDVLTDFGAAGSTPGLMGQVTVEHLLTHTAGFPTAHLPVADWADADARRLALSGWSCRTPPGSTFAYHPLAAHWVLAELTSRIDGAPFTTCIHERVTEPLGLPQALGAPTACGADVRQPLVVGAPPGDDEWRAVGMSPPEPEPADRAQPVDVVEVLSHPVARRVGAPGGGGVMTPSELALFYQGLLHNPGELWSDAVLQDATGSPRAGLIEPMTGMPANRTIGLAVAGDDGYGCYRGFGRRVASPNAFGHDGAGGQLAFADPDTGLSFAFTTDGMDLHAIRQWRRGRDLADAALASIR